MRIEGKWIGNHNIRACQTVKQAELGLVEVLKVRACEEGCRRQLPHHADSMIQVQEKATVST